jgi:hypothetical protein
MTEPSISYLITTKNSTNQLVDLLECIEKYIDGNECIILDDYSDNIETIEILKEYKNKNEFKLFQNHLNKHYSNHKNIGKFYCKNSYIMQLDDDELPSETLMVNLKDIIQSNPDVELFWLPRINVFKGVTDEHAKQWGWNIDNPHKWVNWHGGDYQGRLFKNLAHLRWERPLHEKIEGAMITTKLPKEENFAIYHHKTIEKQIETNLRYNTDFSQELNKGFIIQ